MPTVQSPPGWTAGAGRRQAFWRGVREAPSVGGLVVVTTFLGFGALARNLGFDLGHAVFVSATVFALPGQVVLVDQVAHGAGLLAATIAVTLTAVRLLPMTVYLMPLLRDGQTPRWGLYLLSHLVAITVWVESLRRLPRLPEELRVPYYAGFGLAILIANVLATAIGYVLAFEVPVAIAAALIFLSPLYFLLSLVVAAASTADAAALVLGAILGPLLFVMVPGFDLLLAGLIGGSAAYALQRLRRRRR